MQIIFSNKFGCHSKSELILNYPELVDVGIEERGRALDLGWLITSKNNQTVWYQSRSTRTRLSETNYSIDHSFFIFDQPYPIESLDQIYTEYCQHKHYKKYFEVNEFLDIDIVAGYYNNNELTAWTKLRCYDSQNIESVLFAWDYKDPSSHLGIKSLKTEIAWAKKQGYQYFYMGPGYEKNSIYKSDVDGFEWWTGSEWSQDRDQYIWLCKRDSKVASYHQIHTALANLQHDYSNQMSIDRNNLGS
jgi:hypothetical protein